MQVRAAAEGESLKSLLTQKVISAAQCTRQKSQLVAAANGSDAVASLLRSAERASAGIGQFPASPPGFRAKIGAVGVRLVRRMLFWYTPQIVAAQNAILAVLQEQNAILRDLHVRVCTGERTREALVGDGSNAATDDTGQNSGSVRSVTL